MYYLNWFLESDKSAVKAGIIRRSLVTGLGIYVHRWLCQVA